MDVGLLCGAFIFGKNFFVPVWDTMEDLRHDGISIGSVMRTVRKEKLNRETSAHEEKCFKQYFGLI